jgi:hypothetical protein
MSSRGSLRMFGILRAAAAGRNQDAIALPSGVPEQQGPGVARTRHAARSAGPFRWRRWSPAPVRAAFDDREPSGPAWRADLARGQQRDEP